MGKCLSCCEQADDEAAAGNSSSHQPRKKKPHQQPPKSEVYAGPEDDHDSEEVRRPCSTTTNDNNEGETNRGGGRLSRGGTGVGAMFRSATAQPPPPSSGGEPNKRSNNNNNNNNHNHQQHNHSRSGADFSESKVLELYAQYRDPHEDAILSEGIERFCRDLEVRPEEFRVLLLAWKFGAATMCRFSRAEFVSGCRALSACTARGIRDRFPELMREVREDADKFKDLYRFTFAFGLDADAGQRILPADVAVALWRLVFSGREPPLLGRWLAFLECHPGVRGVPRDTWNMFLNFSEAVGDDLGQYDDAEAWPSLFDDFVDCVRCENDRANQNVAPARKDENEIRIF